MRDGGGVINYLPMETFTESAQSIMGRLSKCFHDLIEKIQEAFGKIKQKKLKPEDKIEVPKKPWLSTKKLLKIVSGLLMRYAGFKAGTALFGTIVSLIGIIQNRKNAPTLNNMISLQRKEVTSELNRAEEALRKAEKEWDFDAIEKEGSNATKARQTLFQIEKNQMQLDSALPLLIKALSTCVTALITWSAGAALTAKAYDKLSK